MGVNPGEWWGNKYHFEKNNMGYIDNLGTSSEIDNLSISGSRIPIQEIGLNQITVPFKLLEVNWSKNLIVFEMDMSGITQDIVARYLLRIDKWDNIYFDTTLKHKKL